MDIKGQEELYDFLNNETLDGEVLYAKSFDDFKTQFSNPKSQENLYNSMIADGFYPEDRTIDDFTNQFFVAEKKNPIETDTLVETAPEIETETIVETEPEKKPKQPANTASQQTSVKPKSSSGGGMIQMAAPSASVSQQPKAGKSQGALLMAPKEKPQTAGEAVLEANKKKIDVMSPNWFNPNKPVKIDIPVVTKNVTESSRELAKQSKVLDQNKVQLDADVAAFENAYYNNPNDPNLAKLKQDLDKKIDAHNALYNQFQLDVNNVNQDRADLKKAMAEKFIDEKDKGNFFGATWNSIVEGYKKIGEAQARVAIDLGIELLSAAGIPISADKKMTKDEAKKAVIGDIMPSLSKGYDVAKSSSTTEAYIQQQKTKGVLPKAWFGVAESLPVMASGGTIGRFVSGASLAYQYANEELDSNPNTANMDENERKKITVPIAVIGGVLEEIGFRTLIGKNKPALIKLSSYIIKQLPKNATLETIKEVASKAVKGPIMNQIVSTAGKLGTGYLGEAETGGAQRILDVFTKEIYDAANNVEFFKNPEILSWDFAKKVGEDANLEGLGGVMMRGIGIGASTAMSVTGVNQMSDKEYAAWRDLATNAASGQLYLSKVISDLSTGRITQVEASQRINDFDRATEIAKQIPNNLSIADQKKAFSIIAENKKIDAGIRDLQKYMEGKNPNLVSNINKQIEDLQKRIEENDNQLTKLSENAVPETPAAQGPVVGQDVVDIPTQGYVSFEYNSEDEIPVELRGIEPISRTEIDYGSNRFNLGNKKIRLTFDAKQLDPIRDALQKQTTSEVPVQPEAGTSQQVAEGEPQAEPQVPTQEGKGQEVAPTGGGGMIQMAPGSIPSQQPTPEQPTGEQPTAQPTAEEPTAQPTAEETTAQPTTQTTAEEPTAQPTTPEQPTAEQPAVQPTAEEPVAQPEPAQPTAEQPVAEEDETEEKPTEMPEKEWNDLQNLATRIANGEDTDSDEDTKLQDKYPTALNSLVAKKVSELPKPEAPTPTASLSTGQKNAIKEGIKKALDMVKRYPKQDGLLTKYRALKDFKKTNQEYINANQSQKESMARKMNIELGLAPKVSAPSAQKILGQEPTMTTVDEAKSLADQLLLEAKAAESGKDFINNARKIILDAIKNRTKGALSPKATKALLNALGGKIDTPKQRAEVISKVIDIFKKSEDVVAVNEGKLRDEKIKLIDQSIKKGQTNFKKAVKDLANEIKAMLPKGVFSPAQLKIVANALASNVLNPNLRQAALDRVNRMANNVIEATKLKEAYNLRTKIRKANIDNLATELQDLAKGFAKIDPRYIDNLDEHLDQARQVFDAIKNVKVAEDEDGNKVVQPRAIIDYAKSQDYTQKQLDKQEEIMKNALLEQHANLVAEGKINDKMSLAQIKAYIKTLEQDPTKSNEEKDQALRDYAQQSFNESKQALQDDIDDGAIDEDDVPLIEAFTKIDLSLMNPMEAYEAAEALMNYRVNGSTSKMGKVAFNFIGALGAKTISENINREGKVEVGGTRIKAYRAFGKALDAVVKIATLGKAKTKIGENFAKRYSDAWFKFNAPIDNLGTTYFGPGNWDVIKEAAGIDKIAQGVVERKKIIAEFSKEITDKYKNAKINGDNVFTAKVATMLDVIAKLYRQTSDPKQKDTYFDNRKKILKETIDYLNSSKDEDDQKQGKLLQEIYDELGIENATNGQQVFDNADPVARNIINDFINKFKEYYPEFSKIAQEQFNIILGQDTNYTGDSWRNVGQTEKSSEDKLFQKGSFATSHDLIETEESGRFVKPKYPDKLPTKNGKVTKIPSFDFFKNQMNALAETINTVKTIEGVNQYVGFMDSPYLDKIITDDASRKTFKDRMDYNISLYQMNEKIGPREGSRFWADLLSYPSKLGAKVGLSSAESVLTQSIPILTNTIANLRNPGYLITAAEFLEDKNMQDFLNNLKYGITQRGGAAQTNIDYANNMLERGDYSTRNKTLQTLKDASNFLVEKGLVGTDVLTAKVTWMAYYMDELAKQGVDPVKIDWANHEVNDKAAKYAEKMVQREQNINLPESGGKLWSSSDPQMKLARMAFPFASFTTSQKDKIKTNMAVLFMDNKLATREEKIAAARSIVGSAAEQYMFNTIKAEIASAITGGAYNIVRKKETDEERKLREKKKSNRLFEDWFETFSGANTLFEKEVDAAVGNFVMRSMSKVYGITEYAIKNKLTKEQIINKIKRTDFSSDEEEDLRAKAYYSEEESIPKTRVMLKREKLEKEIKKPFRLRESPEGSMLKKGSEFIGGVPRVTYDAWIKILSDDIPTIVKGSTQTDDNEDATFTEKETNALLYLLPFKIAGAVGFGREFRKLYDETSKLIKESAKEDAKRRKAERKRMASENN
jgi:hypothetical protein